MLKIYESCTNFVQAIRLAFRIMKNKNINYSSGQNKKEMVGRTSIESRIHEKDRPQHDFGYLNNPHTAFDQLRKNCEVRGRAAKIISNHIKHLLTEQREDMQVIQALTKEQKRAQIKVPCPRCGSIGKTSALNREKERIMITCLKCNYWTDFVREPANG